MVTWEAPGSQGAVGSCGEMESAVRWALGIPATHVKMPETQETLQVGVVSRAGGPCLPRPEEASLSLLSMVPAFSLVSRSRSRWYSLTHCCSVSSGLWPCVAPS